MSNGNGNGHINLNGLVEEMLPNCRRHFYHGSHDDCPGWPTPSGPLAEVPTFILGAELERRHKVAPGSVAHEDQEWRLVSTGPGDADWERVPIGD